MGKVPDMNEQRPKIIKRHKQDSDYIEDHELCLLSLLVKKHPERAKVFLERLAESMKVAA